MKRNKIFSRIIVVTLLITLLTFKVGRVVEVKAIGTTIAASAAAALCAVGIVYCSYMALTGASVHVPDSVENIESWLKDMGTKVVQYPSGRAAYEELYPELIGIGDEPLTSLLDRAWTWTSDKLKLWVNDFSSVDVIQSIASYTQDLDVSNIPLNGYNYDLADIEYVKDIQWGTIIPIDEWLDRGWQMGVTDTLKWVLSDSIVYTSYTYETTRNYYDGQYYYPQYFDGSDWQQISLGFQYWSFIASKPAAGINDRYYVPVITTPNNYYNNVSSPGSNTLVGNQYAWDYPVLPDSQIYDAVEDRYLPLVIPESSELVKNPQYPVLPPEDDNKPVIPYVKLPYDPNWIDPVTGLPGGGNWGFNLAQLLDALEDLAGLLMEIGSIGELINQFKNLINGQSGDEYYIYYDDSTNNYYQYYTITNFGDNIYNYDIDVSEADEHLPVDLNTIRSYTTNRYIDTIKESAQSGSSIIRDLVVFWYDVDPEIIYIFFGCSITVLIAAFIGKWGHS